MPGKKWKRAELRELRRMKKGGFGAAKIVKSGRLPGRTRGAIESQLSHSRWVDKTRSQRVRSSLSHRMTEDERRECLKFLGDYGFLPYTQQVSMWEHDYVRRGGFPPLSATTIGRLLRSHNLHRDRRIALRTPYSREKRAAIKASRRRARESRHAFRAAAEMKRQLQRKAEVLESHPGEACSRCTDCGNDWPRTEEFFNRLPAFFESGEQRAAQLQTGICKVCLARRSRQRVFARSYRQDDRRLKADRDRLWLAALDQAAQQRRLRRLAERDRRVRSHRRANLKVCNCCSEPFPATADWFKPNPPKISGQRSLRGICRLCENEFARRIARQRRRLLPTAYLAMERARLLRGPDQELASSSA